MKNKLFRIVALFMTVVTLGCMTGCSDDDTSNKIPSITITNVQQTALTELTFTLNPKDASSYGYACPTLEDYKAKKYTFTKVDGGEKKTFTVGDLVASSSYVIVAVAYNGANTSEEVYTRVSTSTAAPTLSLLKRVVLDNAVTFTLKTSDNTTKIVYTTYINIDGEDPDVTALRKVWKDQTTINPAGTDIVINDLPTGPYVFEAYAMAKTVAGDVLTDAFAISVTSRPYVDFIVTDVTHLDAQVDLKKNSKCAKYYAGLVAKEQYSYASVMAKLASPDGAAYLMADNYTGSMVAKLKFLSGGWTAATPMTLWIVPCDAEGNYSKEKDFEIKFDFFTEYAYGGKASVDVAISNTTQTTYTADLTATNFKNYYVIYDEKAKFEKWSKDVIVKEYLLRSTAQTAATQKFEMKDLKPDTDYVFYAVAVDAMGYLSALTTKTIHTNGLDLSSKAAFTYTNAPKAQSSTVTFVPNAECTSVRYVCMTDVEYVSVCGGIAKNMQNLLAMDKIAAAKTQIFSADAASRSVEVVGLESMESYWFFAMPMDAAGKFGVMAKPLIVTTTEFDITTTATASIPVFRFQNSTARFSVQPDENCTDCYVVIYNKKLQTNQLIKTILADRNATHMSNLGGGQIPAKSFNMRVPDANATSAIYVLCKGKDGKFNDPNATKKLLLN